MQSTNENNNNNNDNNNEKLDVNLCDYINANITKAMQGIPYWRKHRHHKCYKCHVYGHIAQDCEKVCKLCRNIHSGNLCYHSLITLMKKTIWILKNNSIKDPEKVITKIRKTEQALLKSEAEKSLKLKYENLEVCRMNKKGYRIKRTYEPTPVKYDSKVLQPCVTDQWSMVRRAVYHPSVLLKKIKNKMIEKLTKPKEYGPISHHGQVQLRITQREYTPITEDKIVIHTKQQEIITTPLGEKRTKVRQQKWVLRNKKHVIKSQVGRFVATENHEIEFPGLNCQRNQEMKDMIQKCETTIKKIQKEKSHIDHLKELECNEKKIQKSIARNKEVNKKLEQKIEKLETKKENFLNNYNKIKEKKLKKIKAMQQRLYDNINKFKDKKNKFFDMKDKFFRKQKEEKQKIKNKIKSNMDRHYASEMKKKLGEIEQQVRRQYPNTYKLRKGFQTLLDKEVDKLFSNN